MGSVYKPTYTRAVPDGAETVTQKGKRFARVKPPRGRAKLYPLTEGRDGKLRILITSGKYVAKYRDGHGITRIVATGCRDEQAARSCLKELERRSELVRSGVVTSVEDQIADQQSVPLAVHRDQYITHLRSKSTAELHRRKVSARLTRLFDECRFRKLSDISAERLEKWLLTAEQEGMAARTRNTYRSALIAFCNWAVKSSRLSSNPVARIPPANERTDRRHQRRALSQVEIDLLLDATRRRPLLEAMTIRRGRNAGKPLAHVRPDVREQLQLLGEERRLIYLTLLSTGLRKSELKSVDACQLIDTPTGTFIELEASDEKNGAGNSIPVRPDLAIQLREWIALTTPQPTPRDTIRIEGDSCSTDGRNRPLFRIPDGLDKIFNKDLALAGIEKKDSRGRVVDVHALRTTYCTMLTATGLPARMIQLAMRHGSIETSIRHYADPAIHDLHHAVSALPLEAQFNAPDRNASTGTSDVLVPVLVPDWYKQRPEQPTAGISTHSAGSEHRTRPLAITSCPDTRKASQSSADSEAFSERVGGIEPPPEAWEASVLPLNYTRDKSRHYHGRTVACKQVPETTQAPITLSDTRMNSASEPVRR